MIQKIDSRNRIYLPSEFRKMLKSDCVYLSITNNSLIVCPLNQAYINNEIVDITTMDYIEAIKIKGSEKLNLKENKE